MNTHVQDVCRIGQGALCCKYLMCDEGGFFCGKSSGEWRKIVDNNWEKHQHVAQGDNCGGREQKELNT